MNKFEKLIEYVINDEDGKASDLFHEIVVDKSRQIYEDLMELEMGGDAVDELINDVEADEEGIDYEEDDMDMGDSDTDFDDDGETDDHEGDHEELEDRVVDLEDKLDELMAEFDDLIGGEEEMPMDDEMMDMGDEMPMDDMAMDMEPEMEEGMYESKEIDEEDEIDEEEEVDEDKDALDENVALSNVSKPSNTEEGGVNKSSVNADNAGGKGKKGGAKPVAMGSSQEKGRTAPKAKDMGSTTKPNEKKVAAPKAKSED
jgi:hypothetical protein